MEVNPKSLVHLLKHKQSIMIMSCTRNHKRGQQVTYNILCGKSPCTKLNFDFQMTFKRPATNRQLEFQEISDTARLPVNEVCRHVFFFLPSVYYTCNVTSNKLLQ